MYRLKLSSGKNLMSRNLAKLSIEFKFDKCMLTLSILYLLLYAQFNPRKITVLKMSCLVVAVKFGAPDSMHSYMYKIMMLLASYELMNFHA